jgi:hypothetical protein
MFTPVRKQILSVFSISIITLALLYSAITSAVGISTEVELKGFQNKPGWVFKNTGRRLIRVQIPEPRIPAEAPPQLVTVTVSAPPQPVTVAVEELPQTVTAAAEEPVLDPVTVIINYADGRTEALQVEPLGIFELPPGATAQVIVAETMGPEVAALWDEVDFNLARGLINLLPVPRTVEHLFLGNTEDFGALLRQPSRVDTIDRPSLLEEGGVQALPEEERLIAQLKQIQIERERKIQTPYDEKLAEVVRDSERVREELERAEERARQVAQEEYGQQAREIAAREEELTRQEQEAVVAQEQEPAMKACVEGFFKIYEQFEGAKKAQVLEFRNLCRAKISASSELKQAREALARNKKAMEDVEIARAAAMAKAEREAAAAKLRLAQETAEAKAHIERDLAAALDVARRGGTPLGTPVVTREHSEAPRAQEESAAAVTPSRRSKSVVRSVLGVLDFSDSLLGKKNDTTRRDGDGDDKGPGGFGSLPSSVSLSGSGYSATL